MSRKTFVIALNEPNKYQRLSMYKTPLTKVETENSTLYRPYRIHEKGQGTQEGIYCHLKNTVGNLNFGIIYWWSLI